MDLYEYITLYFDKDKVLQVFVLCNYPKKLLAKAAESKSYLKISLKKNRIKTYDDPERLIHMETYTGDDYGKTVVDYLYSSGIKL